MPETSRQIALGHTAPHPNPANADEIILDPALMRGLPGWKTGTLKDGRAVLELLLDSPEGETQRFQLLLDRPVAAELGRDVMEVSTALHIEPS
jgi:hypothetical protein